MISIPTKFKSKFIHQCHKLHTSPNFRSHQHCPNFTMPNNSTIQKCPKRKQKRNDNVSTSSSQQNMKPTNLPTKKPKKWAHLEVFFGVWSMGLGSWRSPSFSFHSSDGWYFFLLKVRKEGPLEDAIVNAKKMKIWRWVSKNGFVAKMVKNTNIWKKKY